MRSFWDDYMKAYEETIRETATEDSPWYVVPADNKWFTRVVVAAADLGAVPDLEFTALRMLIDAEEKLPNYGVMLWLVGLNSEVFKVVQHSGLGERLGRERMFFTLEQAVESYRTHFSHASEGGAHAYSA